jgi:hypothetical protein
MHGVYKGYLCIASEFMVLKGAHFREMFKLLNGEFCQLESLLSTFHDVNNNVISVYTLQTHLKPMKREEILYDMSARRRTA